jgi:hypothetical protein
MTNEELAAESSPARCYACDAAAVGTCEHHSFAEPRPACRRHATMVPVVVRTLGPHEDTGEHFTIALDLAKGLAVGHSMRSLAHTAKMPADTAAIYLEIGGQIVAAAKAEMAKRIAMAAASAGGAR